MNKLFTFMGLTRATDLPLSQRLIGNQHLVKMFHTCGIITLRCYNFKREIRQTHNTSAPTTLPEDNSLQYDNSLYPAGFDSENTIWRPNLFDRLDGLVEVTNMPRILFMPSSMAAYGLNSSLKDTPAFMDMINNNPTGANLLDLDGFYDYIFNTDHEPYNSIDIGQDRVKLDGSFSAPSFLDEYNDYMSYDYFARFKNSKSYDIIDDFRQVLDFTPEDVTAYASSSGLYSTPEPGWARQYNFSNNELLLIMNLIDDFRSLNWDLDEIPEYSGCWDEYGHNVDKWKREFILNMMVLKKLLMRKMQYGRLVRRILEHLTDEDWFHLQLVCDEVKPSLLIEDIVDDVVLTVLKDVVDSPYFLRQSLIDGVRSQGSVTESNITSTMTSLYASLGNTLDDGFSSLNAKVDGVAGRVDDNYELLNDLNSIIDDVTSAVTNLPSDLQSIINSALDDKINDDAPEGNVFTRIRSKLEAIPQWLADNVNEIRLFISNPSGYIPTKMNELLTKIETGEATWNAELSKIVGAVVGDGSELSVKLTNIRDSILGNMLNIGSISDAVRSVVENVFDLLGVTRFLQEILDSNRSIEKEVKPKPKTTLVI